MNWQTLQKQLNLLLATDHAASDCKQTLGQLFSHSLPLPAQDGLKIYKSNYTSLLYGVLSEIFVCTKKLLSENNFRILAYSYIASHRSSARDLNLYGESFPTFLGNAPQLASFSYVRDLAILEWHWDKSFYEAEDKALGPEDFTRLIAESPESTRLQLRTSSRVVALQYPALALWQALQQVGNPDSMPSLSPDSQMIFLYRNTGEQWVSEIEQELWPVLDGIAQGRTLQEIAASGYIEAHPERLGECIQLLLQRKWLSAHPANK